MTILGVIPARFASTRFPGKPLALINGKSMIRRVYEQAQQCKRLSGLTVATDDERIRSHVISFGGSAVMTSPHHSSGTDRCAETHHLMRKQGESFDAIINIQGDEPFLDPEHINTVGRLLEKSQTQIASLYKVIQDEKDVLNPNIVKVVLGLSGEALYFSRAPIPYRRVSGTDEIVYYKHIGIYGYNGSVLDSLGKLQQSPLEKAEHLEQLRWLENGFRITMAETKKETIAIDVPEDLERVKGM